MKSIILLIPYFGKLPNYFAQFLLTCQYNPTIDFLLMTDDKTQFSYPPNFKVVYCTFEDVKKRVQKAFDFPVSLNNSYKLCDYRPAYGEIFNEYIKSYDFWGGCDIDLLFGDIRHFYTESVLNQYCKIGHLGHLTIYKNTPEINSFYKKTLIDEEGKIIVPYKIAFSKEQGIGFDEWMFNSCYYKVNELFMNYNKPVWYETCYADLAPFTRPFVESYYDPYRKSRKEKKKFYYTWSKGKLYAHGLFTKKQEERLYVHFLKRGMDIKNTESSNCNLEQMLIVPNCIKPGDDKPSFVEAIKVVILNAVNPEWHKRTFWVLCGKIIRILRKHGLWKSQE